MLLAGRDLLESLLTVGGEASVGRGVLCGTLTATLTEPGQPTRTYQMTTSAGADVQTVTDLDTLLRPLLARSSSPAIQHFLETGAWI